MPIKQKPFRKYNLEEEKHQDTFTIRLNKEERIVLEKCKKVLEQRKDGTAFKQMALLGANVLHDNLIGGILQVVFINKRKNKRIGIVEYEQM